MFSLPWTLRLALLLGVMPLLAFSAPHKTENLFLITVDGFRWQELFTGAEELLLNPDNGACIDTNRLQRAFWRKSPEARREALLPFVWGEIARQGQIFGNKTKDSVAQVTN